MMAVFLSLLLLVIFQLSGASTEFSITKSGVSCSGALQVDSLSLDCGGGYCTFGSDVIVEGAGTSKSMGLFSRGFFWKLFVRLT
jgi:hypothetical protein